MTLKTGWLALMASIAMTGAATTVSES